MYSLLILVCFFFKFLSPQTINCVIRKEYVGIDCETPLRETIPVRFYFLNPSIPSILLVDAPDGGRRIVNSTSIQDDSFNEFYMISSSYILGNSAQTYDECVNYVEDQTFFNRYSSVKYSLIKVNSTFRSPFPFSGRIKVTEFDSEQCFKGGDYVTYYLPRYEIDTYTEICHYGLGGWFDIKCNLTDKYGTVDMYDGGGIERRSYFSKCADVPGLSYIGTYGIDPENTFNGTLKKRGFCSKIVCPNICYNRGEDDLKVCSGHGTCVGYNDCSCSGDYTYSQCSGQFPDDEGAVTKDISTRYTWSSLLQLLLWVL